MKTCGVCYEEWCDSAWVQKGHMMVMLDAEGFDIDDIECETCGGTGELPDDHECAIDAEQQR